MTVGKNLSQQIICRRKEMNMSRYMLIKKSKLCTNTVVVFEKTGRCNLSSFLAILDALELTLELKPTKNETL